MSLSSPLLPANPNTLTNGTPADATQVMANFNNIVNNINSLLNSTTGAGYIGLSVDARLNGTSLQDAITQLLDRSHTYTDTGAVNALVITPNPAMTSLAAGQSFFFTPANTTTSASATININGIGAVGIANQDGVLLPAGALIVGSYYIGETAGPGNPIRVLNPSRATFSFTGTYVGGTTAPTATITGEIGGDGKAVSVACVAGISATSNSTQFSLSGAPTALLSATNRSFSMTVTNNGVAGTGTVNFNTSGSLVFGNPGVNGFTASGAKGLLASAAATGSLN